MIFDLLTPSQGPSGRGHFFTIARLIYNSHTKFGWILSSGEGGDRRTDENGRTDGRTEAITISPSLFLKRGDN